MYSQTSYSMFRCHKKNTTVYLLLLLMALLCWTMSNYKNPQINGEMTGPKPNKDTTSSSDIPNRTKRKCRDTICSEYLTKGDHVHFDYCIKKTWPTQRHREPKESVCQFMDGSGRHPVALASYPGSGNTWVRGLLQEVTGLCTGGVYCDVALRQSGFPGEGVRSGAVLVVKTHQTDPRWSGVHYDKNLPLIYYKKLEHIPICNSAILLVRFPFAAIVAQHNRLLNVDSIDTHTAHGEPEEFGNNSQWNDFILEQAKQWQETIFSYVVNNYNHPLLVISFEELQINREAELRKMLDFLQVPYSASRLKRVVQQDYTKYKRKKREFKHYTREQEEYVMEVIQETIDAMAGHKQLNFLANYLHTTVP